MKKSLWHSHVGFLRASTLDFTEKKKKNKLYNIGKTDALPKMFS